MQQRAGAGGSDVLVGQVLNVVLSELCALHGRQMLKQLSHVATLVLLQQHQYNLKKQLIIIDCMNIIYQQTSTAGDKDRLPTKQ